MVKLGSAAWGAGSPAGCPMHIGPAGGWKTEAHLRRSIMQQVNRLILFLIGVIIYQYGHGQDMNVCLANLHRSIDKNALVYYSDSIVSEIPINNSDFIIPERIIIDIDSVIINLRTKKGKEYSFQLVSKMMKCRHVSYSFEDPRLRKRLNYWGDYCGEQSTIGRLGLSSKPTAALGSEQK